MNANIPKGSSCLRVLGRIPLDAAPDNKILFRKGDNPEEVLEKDFEKEKKYFITNKYQPSSNLKKKEMTQLIYAVQRYGKYITNNTQRVIRFYFELNNKQFKKLIDLAQHRNPTWDILWNKLFTQSILEFCAAIDITDLVDKMDPTDPQEDIRAIVVPIIQTVSGANKLAEISSYDGLLCFNLHELDLQKIVLHGLKPRPGKFSLVASRFDEANITDFQFKDCSMQNASFCDATLTTGKFISTSAANTIFTRSTLNMVTFQTITDFNPVQFESATFTKSTINDCTFNNGSMASAKAQRTLITASIFTKVNLAGANFSEATIVKSEFSTCTLAGCHFDRATIVDSAFKNSPIDPQIQNKMVSFIGARLVKVHFVDLDLRTFDFSGAILISVHFINCKFGPQQLQQLDFQQVYIEQLRLQLNLLEELDKTIRGLGIKDRYHLTMPGLEQNTPEIIYLNMIRLKLQLQLLPARGLQPPHPVELPDAQPPNLNIEGGTGVFTHLLELESDVDRLFAPNSPANILTFIERLPDTQDFLSTKITFFKNFFEHLIATLKEKKREALTKKIKAEKAQFLSFFFGKERRFLTSPSDDISPVVHKFLADYILHTSVSSSIEAGKEYTFKPDELRNIFDEFVNPCLVQTQVPAFFYSTYNRFANHFLYMSLVKHANDHSDKGIALARAYTEKMPLYVRNALRASGVNVDPNQNPLQNLVFTSTNFQHIAVISVRYYERYVLGLDEEQLSNHGENPQTNLNFRYFVARRNHTDQIECTELVATSLAALAPHISIFQLVLENSVQPKPVPAKKKACVIQ